MAQVMLGTSESERRRRHTALRSLAFVRLSRNSGRETAAQVRGQLPMQGGTRWAGMDDPRGRRCTGHLRQARLVPTAIVQGQRRSGALAILRRLLTSRSFVPGQWVEKGPLLFTMDTTKEDCETLQQRQPHGPVEADEVKI
jgi:hypothetical protein